MSFRASGNPERHWIPEPGPYLIRGQARNDKQREIYIVVYRMRGSLGQGSLAPIELSGKTEPYDHPFENHSFNPKGFTRWP